jgi:hypothetical protein
VGGRRRRLEKIVRRLLNEGSNKSLLGERELEIIETGLITRSEREQGSYTWDVIERIGFTPDYTFIFISTVQGIAIAKSSVFEGDYEEFKEELRRRFEEKLRIEGAQQKRSSNRKVVTDTTKICKEDAGFGKHSGCGIASFVISIAAGVLYVSILGLMIILAVVDQELTQSRPAILHIFTVMVIAGLFSNIVGVLLGISGLCQKNRKRLFAILGLIFNLTAVTLFGVLIAIGKAGS